MGPRKSVAIRKKRSEGEASMERRSKRREEQAARQPQAPPPAPVISMLNRPVTTGRKIYFDFIDREHFRFGDLIRAQGWEKFCTLEEPVYPRLVRMFFENLKIGTSSISSTVKGTLIVLDTSRLSNLLDMPAEGLCYLNLQNKLDGLKVILEDEDTLDIRNLQANRLSVEMRLLHNIVSRIFFPKTGRFDWVTEKDIAFIYYLVKGKPMNLPFMMLCQMKEAARKQRACLPYGMVFTLIFREFGIDCSGEDAKKLLHTDRYTESSLHRMGYVKIDGRWTKKTSGQAAASDSSDDDDDDEEEEEAPQDAGVSAQHSSPQTPPAPAPPASSSAPQSSQPTVFSSEQMDQLSALIDSKIEEAKKEILKKIDDGIEKLHRHQLGHFSLINMSTASIGDILKEMMTRNAPPSPPASSSAVAMSSNPIVDPASRATRTQADPGPSTRTYRRSARRPPPPPAGPATRTRSQASHRSESKGDSAAS